MLILFPVYCHCVLPGYLPAVGESSFNRDEVIATYFNLGLSYSEILAFLSCSHGVDLSLRQLKRVLKSKRLSRRKNYSPLQEVVNAVRKEISGSGESIGYRQMHQRLITDYCLVVKRETVRVVLKRLDPEGVDLRSRRAFRRRLYSVQGPNYMWHLDGYDKLKPFGFAIHGAIDGYSGRILWLNVGPSNNDPRVIASYYLSCVQQNRGVPMIMRGDRGTENSHVAGIQRFLRRNSCDAFSGNDSFMYGRSVSNQRIEAWWSFLRKSETDWWIKFFKDLRDSGQFSDANPLQVDCIRFCFTPLIQAELNRVARHWNLHKIRPSSNNESPPGRPDVLFFLPQLLNTADYKTPAPSDEIEIATEMCSTNGDETVQGCEEFLNLAELIMDDEGLNHPSTADEALVLYRKLVICFEKLL